MPGGDRTGPMGRGPMSGRGLGLCSGSPTPGYATPGYGQGFGRGWGRGFGRGFWGRGRGFRWREYRNPDYWPRYSEYPAISKDAEKSYLEEVLKNLELEIEDIKKRISDITTKNKE